MPRTKSFNVDEALDVAVDVFWRRGFAATSMEDLVAEMGINRGSLYATFGSKESLYELALARYADGALSRLAEILNDEAHSMAERIETLLRAAASGDQRGCLVVNTAMERGAEHEASRQAAADVTRRMRMSVAEAIRVASNHDGRGNTLSDGFTPESAANVVLATMQGLKVSATIEPDSQDMLYAVVDDTVRMLFAVR